MASGRNNAARKYEDQVPAQREVQPKRHLQVAAAPVKKKKHRRKPAVMQGVYPCIFLVAITAALQSENVSLTTKQMNSMNMDEVEQYATDTLGMIKLDNSQIEYVELTNPDLVTVADDSMTLCGLWSALAARFSALVEYIR